MSGFMSIRQVGPLITTFVVSHVAFSVASIARAGLKGTGPNDTEECFDAKHYDLMTDFVARMYRGKGMKSLRRRNDKHGDRNAHEIIGVKLAPTVTFEDPAAICVGEEEVREAFRALQALGPEPLSPPICINVEPRGDSIDLSFQLNQQYTLPFQLFSGRPSQIHLRSLLIVTVKLQQMKDLGLPESEFLITEMKELWFGNPLMWPYQVFYIPRRLNGVVSYHLTSRLL